MSTPQIAQAPLLQPMPGNLNYGPPSASGKPKKGNGQQQASADNITLSNGTVIGGTIAMTMAALGIGAGGTFLAMRNKSESRTTESPEPASRNISHEAMAFHRIDAQSLATPIATVPTDLGTENEYPSPLVPTGPRFHPRQSGDNCAVDTLNMLVNGYQPLRIAPIDYNFLMNGLDLQGKSDHTVAPHSAAKYADGNIPYTITEPKDFPAIYKRNIEIAKKYLDHPHNVDVRDNPEMKIQWKNELEKINDQAGNLQHREFDMSSKEVAKQLAQALDGFNGRAIAIAKPLKKNVLGVVQARRNIGHHYLTLENNDGTWIKRDSSKDYTIDLKYNGKPATSAHEAVLAEYEHEKDPRSLMDHEHPIMHVFIPGKP